MNEVKFSSIQLTHATMIRLKILKVIPRETYEEVIKRLILNFEDHNNDK